MKSIVSLKIILCYSISQCAYCNYVHSEVENRSKDKLWMIKGARALLL